MDDDIDVVVVVVEKLAIFFEMVVGVWKSVWTGGGGARGVYI